MVNLLSQVKTAWKAGRHNDALLYLKAVYHAHLKEVYQAHENLAKKNRKILNKAFADEIGKAECMCTLPT